MLPNDMADRMSYINIYFDTNYHIHMVNFVMFSLIRAQKVKENKLLLFKFAR